MPEFQVVIASSRPASLAAAVSQDFSLGSVVLDGFSQQGLRFMGLRGFGMLGCRGIGAKISTRFVEA